MGLLSNWTTLIISFYQHHEEDCTYPHKIMGLKKAKQKDDFENTDNEKKKSG